MTRFMDFLVRHLLCRFRGCNLVDVVFPDPAMPRVRVCMSCRYVWDISPSNPFPRIPFDWTPEAARIRAGIDEP